jgi:hypothetical protein
VAADRFYPGGGGSSVHSRSFYWMRFHGEETVRRADGEVNVGEDERKTGFFRTNA